MICTQSGIGVFLENGIYHISPGRRWAFFSIVAEEEEEQLSPLRKSGNVRRVRDPGMDRLQHPNEYLARGSVAHQPLKGSNSRLEGVLRVCDWRDDACEKHSSSAKPSI